MFQYPIRSVPPFTRVVIWKLPYWARSVSYGMFGFNPHFRAQLSKSLKERNRGFILFQLIHTAIPLSQSRRISRLTSKRVTANRYKETNARVQKRKIFDLAQVFFVNRQGEASERSHIV